MSNKEHLSALEQRLDEIDFEKSLCKAFLKIENEKEMMLFLKDLLTPKELSSMIERWKVCQLLERGDLSYREIHALTSASLTTIGRVSRFINEEQNHGYRLVLSRMDPKEKI
ncbi:MAG TPA: trp operon repressor [Candidatus Ignatzschineria merdigallinarum]|uniref:Trp operon repressor n=1 Tax=Candidatus Ignatzschineria merdigallinarum TaxID=2838621 RepID=A0A9D1Q5Z0_9GAMM|nr:trp operon repressor [Candidatus Ignatzschineria merdigallinarum]